MLKLNENAINVCNSLSHFNAGDNIVKSANALYYKHLDVFADSPEYSQEQLDYLSERFVEWEALVTKVYNQQLHDRASWVPVTVAGPANFNGNKNRSAVEREMRNAIEWQAKIDRFLDNTRKKLKELEPLENQLKPYSKGLGDVIKGDDPYAIIKLKTKIEALKIAHERNKALNAYYKKHKTCVGFEGLSDEKADKIDKQIADVNQGTVRQPVPHFSLSNNLAEIKRLERRVATLERKQANGTTADESREGLKIVRNVEADRMQLIFDCKPNEDIRTILKQNGFRWSPRFGAWQRVLNNNSEYALQRVLKSI